MATTSSASSSHPVHHLRATFWRTPRGIIVILSVACFFVYLFNPIVEDTIQLPRDWESGTWRGSDAINDIEPDSAVPGLGNPAGLAKLAPSSDEWDVVKQKQEEAKIRKEAWEKKKYEDEEETKRRKEVEDRRKQEEEDARISKEHKAVDQRKKEDEERRKKADKEQRKKEEGEARRKQQEEDRRKKEGHDESKKEDKSTSTSASSTSSTSTTDNNDPGPTESSKKGNAEEQKDIAEARLEEADSKDPANNEKDLSEPSKSNFNTSDISLTVDTKNSGPHLAKPANRHNITTSLVVGRLNEDASGVQWIRDFVEDLTNKHIYIVDDPGAPLHLNKNKGREAMVYLRYILDYYDKLDDVTLFYHSSRMAWHNNVLFNRDAAVMINNLRRNYVLEVGYMNARCELYPGCQSPGWIKWNPTPEENNRHAERNSDLFDEKLWNQLFPNRTRDPVWLSEPCCSQFAVSRETIRKVPVAQYQRIHDWLGTTEEVDGFTGRIMEYVWQYLFLDTDKNCPSMKDCYCKGYGTCLIDDTELKEYNRLRTEVDDLLSKLGEVNEKNGCNNIDDEEKKDACRKGNPFEEPLKETRRRKQAYEKTLPVKYGIMDPLGR